MDKKIRIIYFGTSDFAVPPLTALNNVAEISLVVTQPAKKSGRGGKLTESPIFNAATSLGLNILQPESCKDEGFIAEIEKMSPDLIVVAAYGQFLPEKLLEIPQYKAINIHGSILPHLRGAAPIQRAIQAGDAKTGVTLIYMVKKMDAGDIIKTKETSINSDDTYGILHERLSHIGAELLLETLPSIIAGNIEPKAQNETEITFAPPIEKNEREIDWSASALEIHRKVMAFNPNPMAITTFKNAPLKMYTTKVISIDELPCEGIFTAGQVACADKNNGLIIKTGDGLLQILQLQPAGKNIMSGREFINGYQIKQGDNIFEVN